MPGRFGFSFIELMTVVALIAIVCSSAAPVASSLFQRHREMVLRENLLTLRKALAAFERNQYDDDSDGEMDEDPRGDANHDGFPGIRGLDDDGDTRTDEDWGNRSPYVATVGLNPSFDWLMRRDDDEDGLFDEEAFPSDLNDLAMKAPILHKSIPLDPTLRIAAWGTVTMKNNVTTALGQRLANNDSDWFVDNGTVNGTPDPGEPMVISTDAVYQAGYDIPLTVPAPGDGTAVLQAIDCDPRNRQDDDGDGRLDEDAADVLDLRSYNSAKGLSQTSYCDW